MTLAEVAEARRELRAARLVGWLYYLIGAVMLAVGLWPW